MTNQWSRFNSCKLCNGSTQFIRKITDLSENCNSIIDQDRNDVDFVFGNLVVFHNQSKLYRHVDFCVAWLRKVKNERGKGMDEKECLPVVSVPSTAIVTRILTLEIGEVFHIPPLIFCLCEETIPNCILIICYLKGKHNKFDQKLIGRFKKKRIFFIS